MILRDQYLGIPREVCMCKSHDLWVHTNHMTRETCVDLNSSLTSIICHAYTVLDHFQLYACIMCEYLYSQGQSEGLLCLLH